MKITIKPAAPPPAPVPVPASSLRPGDRFRCSLTGHVFIRTQATIGSSASCIDTTQWWLGSIHADDPVIRCDNDGNPIIPPAPEPKVVTLGELAVGDVFRYAEPTPCRGYRMKLAPDIGHTIPFLRLHDTDLGEGMPGYDGASCRVIKVEAELIIREGGDR